VAPGCRHPSRRKHRGFSFDPTHAPAQHTQAVDHGGVRIGADECVRVGAAGAALFGVENHAPEILEVYLVNDASVGWHDREVAERRLSPAQERVTLAVAREFDGSVGGERTGSAVLVDLHRMVDHQFRRVQRVDAFGATTQAHDGIAHGRQVHHTRHAGEVLQNDACGGEGDLVGRGRLRVPLQQCFDVGAGHAHAVLEAQQILEQNLQRVGQSRELVLRQRRETPDLVRAITRIERRARAEAVDHACLRVNTPLYRPRRALAAPRPLQAAAAWLTVGAMPSMTAPPRQRSPS